MGIATISFDDTADLEGNISFTINFEGGFDKDSQAHQAALAIAETVAEQSGVPLQGVYDDN